MKIALIGNPNSGKTTLFNVLTGSNAHVGNWPGVTVEKKTGVYKKLAEKIELIDLPGIYSLSPYTPEEIVSRNYLLNDRPDVIINIIDSTNLERNLYLTTQLLELEIPVVVALNMSDVLSKSGKTVEKKYLEEIFKIPFVEISALKKRGVKLLMEVAFKEAKNSREVISVFKGSKIGDILSKTVNLYKAINIKNPVFHSVKMIERDTLEESNFSEIAKEVENYRQSIDSSIFKGDFEGLIANERYNFISKSCARVYKKECCTKMNRSDKIDRVLTNRFFGIPFFLFAMFLVFHFTFSENLFYLGGLIPDSFEIPFLGSGAINSPGVVLFNLMEWGTDSLGEFIAGILPEGKWWTGLILNGILGGLFAVLSFLPQILTLFFFIGILEDSGYMARVAFIMDRAFRRFGLSGKVFLPLVMCFGCAIPGIVATRTLNDDKERQRAIYLTPFFSCGAKLPIWAAFAGVFSVSKGMNAEIIVYSMYVLGILIAIVSAIFLNKTFIRGALPPFIMELPNYHIPAFRNLLFRVWDKLKHYIYRVSTILVGSVIVIWFLSSFNFTLQMVSDSGDSIIGIISKGLSWLFIPLGFGMGVDGWKFVVAIFTGLIAKEMVVATMGTFSGMENGEMALEIDGADFPKIEEVAPLTAMMFGIGGGALFGLDISIPAMFSFMAFNLLSVPCMAAVAAARGELMSAKKLWGAIAFWMATAYLVSFIIFWMGVFFLWLF